MGVYTNRIVVNNNMQEIFEYPKSDFPFIAWYGDYESFPQHIENAHWHSDVDFFTLLRGEVDYYVSAQHIHLKAGECLFVNSSTLHMGQQCSGYNAVTAGITLSDTIMASERHENDVKMMISFIKKYYSENISVQDIATAVGISRTECFRSFKRFSSKTPVEYLLETRLSSAADMLIMGNDTVLEICMKCGFSGSSYFGKRFKERYGMTPVEFRNSR